MLQSKQASKVGKNIAAMALILLVSTGMNPTIADL
jgi:hypothetical protein